jgi:hypothetical protein
VHDQIESLIDEEGFDFDADFDAEAQDRGVRTWTLSLHTILQIVPIPDKRIILEKKCSVFLYKRSDV